MGLWLAVVSCALLSACIKDRKTPEEDSGASASPPSNNSAPSISGRPPTQVVAGQAYDFRPVASDPDGDTITFSIQNKPGWASFNTSTGRLSGTPTASQVRSYNNIVIGVNDGEASASLAAFGIDVVQAGNGAATLSWTPPTTRSDGSTLVDLAGYNILYGRSSGSYSNRITLDNPGLTAYVIENLATGTWFFAMTAFDSKGLESSRSAEASKTIP
jgi:hypothetical protein